MRRSPILLLLACIPLVTVGEGLTLEPGRYETTMTRTNPVTGLTKTDTTTECIEEAKEFRPSDLLEEAEGCEMLEESSDAQSMQFVMKCAMGGGEGRFSGEFQQSGDVGTGHMELDMNLGEFSMTMEMDWESKRLGDC